MPTPVQRKIENLKANWYVWLFPTFAMLISVWLFKEFYEQRGPDIHIVFDDASGLQPEKTQIRFRGVAVGVVKGVSISDDNKNVIAKVRLQRDAQQFARKGAKYWVVVPKVDLQGISGLETLFQGSYIAALPGEMNAEEVLTFDGKIGGESSDPLEDTVAYYLESGNVGSMSAGNPVTFRGLNIGSVTSVNLSKDGKRVIVQINIQNKFVRLVRTNSVFWRKVGVHADLGLFKAEVKINSLESLMKGGVDVFTPTEAGPIANAKSSFVLGEEPPKGWERWNPVLEF